MPRNALSLFLLLVMGLGLFAGPHPCHARQARPKPAGTSCHMPAKAKGPATSSGLSAPGGHDCCKTNHSSLCENVCQMTAVAQTEQLRFRIAPVAQTTVETSCPERFLLAQSIDHVPLA